MAFFLASVVFLLFNASVVAVETALLRFSAVLIDPSPATFVASLATWIAASSAGTWSAGRLGVPNRRSCAACLSLAGCSALFVFGVFSGFLARSPDAIARIARIGSGGPRWALLAPAILAPAFLSGLAFPILSEWLETGRGRRLTLALSFGGSSLGALVAAFALLPLAGLRMTALWSACVLWGCAIASAAAPRAAARPSETGTAPERSVDVSGLERHWIAATAFIAGAVTLALQAALFRAHATLSGRTAFSAGLAVGVFFAGLCIGSLLHGVAERGLPSLRRRLARSTAAASIAASAAALAVPWLLNHASVFLPARLPAAARSVLPAALFAVLLFLPAAAAAGAILPCCIEFVSNTEGGGRTWRMPYLFYGVGALAGGIPLTILAGAVGTRGLLLLASLSALIGLAGQIAFAPRREIWKRSTLAAALAVPSLAAAALSPWDPAVLTRGPVVLGPPSRSVTAGTSHAGPPETLVFFREGLHGVTSVHRAGPAYSLRVNGVGVSHSAFDAVTQRMLALLPASVARPRSALVIGLGSGQTFGDLVRAGVAGARCVEISEDVVAAARHIPLKYGYPSDRVVIDDAKRFLERAAEPLDLIVSQPSHPWSPGSGNLFTEDFYFLAAGRLAPGGLFCQWMQTYGADPDDVELFLRTFAKAFPAYTVWSFAPGDIIVLGGKEPMQIPLETWIARLEEAHLRALLAGIGLGGAEDVLAGFLASSDTTALPPGPTSGYDLPSLEFRTAVKIGVERVDRVHRRLDAWCKPPPSFLRAPPRRWAHLARRVGQRLALHAEWARAESWLLAALQNGGDNGGIANDLALVYYSAGKTGAARRWIETARKLSNSKDIIRNYKIITGNGSREGK